MNILITGGNGFLGRHMVDALIKNGHRLLLLTRSKGNLINKKEQGISFWKGDLTNPESIDGITRNVDVVYHFAAQLGEWGVPDKVFYTVNVQGTDKLLLDCLKNNLPRFIFISTPGVQGKGLKKAKEEFPYNPPHIYEKTKCEAEKLVLKYHELYGLPIEIVRPDFVYGPGDYRRIKLYRAIKCKRFMIIGDGKSILHPTYIADVIQALLLLGQHKQGFNDIFNIAGPEQLTVKAYTNEIAAIVNSKIYRMKVPVAIASIAARIIEKYACYTNKPPFISKSKIEFLTNDHGTDISKSQRLLKYQPRYSFKEGFKKTYDWALLNNLL